MQANSQPLVVLYGYSSKRNELQFIGRKGIITLSGKAVKIRKLLRLCTGMTSVRDIVDKLRSMTTEEIFKLLELLETQGIVRDSRELHIGFHEDSANPGIFSYDLGVNDAALIMKSQRLRERDGRIIRLPVPDKSNTLDVIHKRQSIRQFQDGQIPGNKLSGLLEATYGIGENGHWSVPSGGAMYPLDLYLIVHGDSQSLPIGIYRWNPEDRVVTVISEKNPNVWLTKVFNTKMLLEHAAYILCIAVNLKRTISKYANRGYRHIMLEAGHAAQNAYLFCAEQDLGIVEYSGFNDKALARELGLQSSNEVVAITLIVGTKDRSGIKAHRADQEIVESANHLRRTLVGHNKPIRSVFFWEPEVNGNVMSQWGAVALYSPPYKYAATPTKKRCRAFATGSTSSEAVVKVLAEGFERYSLEQQRNDRIECALKLNEAFLDPRTVVPYMPAQGKILKDIKRFDPREKIGWVIGAREVTGARVWVPTELVFYACTGIQGDRKIFYRANSSGVAAHFEKQLAVEAALCELIERDAISVTWYAKRHVNAISHEYFSNTVRERVLVWEELGYKVSFLDLTLDGQPVILVVIWSRDKRPALFSGASCRSIFIDAAERAFNEAEFMAMTWHGRKQKRNMDIRDVQSPDDHGLFYSDPKNLVYAEWLLEANGNQIPPKDFSGDLSRFDPIVVNITPKEYDCGLTVVRVLSEKLMPINFGYGSEHFGHPRMAVVGLKWNMEYPSIPHFFA
ncbi:MAG: YcaO-like family protein [Patescibacteria group bacterium]